jgi:hypothetical protein
VRRFHRRGESPRLQGARIAGSKAGHCGSMRIRL